MTVYGWDLSNHDWDRHPVDLADARRNGVSFVTHKATEGNWYRDPRFVDFARELGRTSFPVEGSYHALNHGIRPHEQADYWVQYVSQVHPQWRQHPCWTWQIDCEPLDGYQAPTMEDIMYCGQRLQNVYHIPASHILVYGPSWVYGDSLRNLPYRLWASHYVRGTGLDFKRAYPGDASSFWQPYSGQTPLVLQYSSTTTIGAQHTCDANAIRVANEVALQALFGVKPVAVHVPPAQTGIDAMTPAERQALINEIAAAVWEKPFTHAQTKTTASAGTWLVYANRFALSSTTRIADSAAKVDALAPKLDALASKIDGLVAKFGALDAGAIAQDVKNRIITLLGGTPS